MITLSKSPKHSQRLRRRIDLVLPELGAVSMELLEHPNFPELYLEYGFTLHTVIRASVNLMETALRRARELASADPVAADLVPYLAQHIKEEMHHDDWLLEDLELVGVSRSDVLDRPPSATVAAMVGAQYYWIQHCHPVALAGYLLILEGNPPTPSVIQSMVEKTGYPRKAFRCLEKHAQLDPHHRDELDEMVDGLPLLPNHFAIIGASALHTVRLLATAWREILDSETAMDPAGAVGSLS